MVFLYYRYRKLKQDIIMKYLLSVVLVLMVGCSETTSPLGPSTTDETESSEMVSSSSAEIVQLDRSSSSEDILSSEVSSSTVELSSSSEDVLVSSSVDVSSSTDVSSSSDVEVSSSTEISSSSYVNNTRFNDWDSSILYFKTDTVFYQGDIFTPRYIHDNIRPDDVVNPNFWILLDILGL
jgi:hypothetical protein